MEMGNHSSKLKQSVVGSMDDHKKFEQSAVEAMNALLGIRPIDSEDYGKMLHGCKHYRRRCKIRAPCCDEVFTCRHCHNDAKSLLSDPNEQHELVRHDVKQVVCAVCNTEQLVSAKCVNCGIKFGEYFCEICKFYDDDTEKNQFHCNGCGICRVGGRENFIHCDKCVRRLNILRCGHTQHYDCFYKMIKLERFRCPICNKSAVDMSRKWRALDREIANAAMSESESFDVQILCYDCTNTSTVRYHIYGLKCLHCNSYNTLRMYDNSRDLPMTV